MNDNERDFPNDDLADLAEEAGRLFETDDIMSETTLSKSKLDEEMCFERKRVPFKLNWGFLVIGAVAIILPAILFNQKDNTGQARDNTIDNSVVVTDVTESVKVTQSTTSIEYEIEGTESAIKEQHLTNIPVVVTEEVDSYFKDTIYYLKAAMRVDNFIATNELYGNIDLVQTYLKLVDDFNTEVSGWSSHTIPAGCEKFDEMICKSIVAYQYYFDEVANACDLETEEDYRNKLRAAALYVETTVDYSDVVEDFLPVFYYYGLYE